MLDKEFIKRKVALIEEELAVLSEYRNTTIEGAARDVKVRAVIERLLEKVITRAIDINQHIIAELGAGERFPRKYRETFLLLSEFGVYSNGKYILDFLDKQK